MSMPEEEVQRYLPSLERARSEGLELPSGHPSQVEKLALLVVQAVFVRRTSFVEDAPSASLTLERGEPPVPLDFEVRHHVRIDDTLGAGGPCPVCTEKPGFRRCRVCGGVGTLFNGTRLCSCDRGYVPCPSCGGTATLTKARLRYYTDAPGILNEAYMPSHVGHVPTLFSLETRMEEDIVYQAPQPEALRCHDLTGRVAGSAYRGGGRVVRPDFHGHDFGDAIDKALAGLAAIGAGAQIVRYDVRAYARPFLKLGWFGHSERALYVDRLGNHRVFCGSGAYG